MLISEYFGGGLVVLETESGSVIKRLQLGRGASGILVPPEAVRATSRSPATMRSP